MSHYINAWGHYIVFWGVVSLAVLIAVGAMYLMDTPIRRMVMRTRRKLVLKALQGGSAPISHICSQLTASGFKSGRRNLLGVILELEREGLVRSVGTDRGESSYELVQKSG